MPVGRPQHNEHGDDKMHRRPVCLCRLCVGAARDGDTDGHHRHAMRNAAM